MVHTSATTKNRTSIQYRTMNIFMRMQARRYQTCVRSVVPVPYVPVHFTIALDLVDMNLRLIARYQYRYDG